MKLVIIGCTHGLHDMLKLPDGDVLIHTGDVSNYSTKSDVLRFGKWFGHQKHEHKICIAGNHDKFMSSQFLPDNVTYLQDSAVTINGLKFYGSPWTPMFFDWHWMKERGEEIAERWRLIPDDTNVLITHGPAQGILDKTEEGVHAGCEELSKTVERVCPQIHCFSHIHEGAGIIDSPSMGDSKKAVTSINASIVTRKMQPTNAPVVIDL